MKKVAERAKSPVVVKRASGGIDCIIDDAQDDLLNVAGRAVNAYIRLEEVQRTMAQLRTALDQLRALLGSVDGPLGQCRSIIDKAQADCRPKKG